MALDVWFREHLIRALRVVSESRPPEIGDMSLPDLRIYEAGYLAAVAALATALGLEEAVKYKVLEGKKNE